MLLLNSISARFILIAFLAGLVVLELSPSRQKLG